MNQVYKCLTESEYNVLNKILIRNHNDCWADIRQNCHGVDYIYDTENRKRMCLTTGVSLIVETFDDQDLFDWLRLEWYEKVTLRNLLAKLKIECHINWGLPRFIGMSREGFLNMCRDVHIRPRKDGDDYAVNDVVYQFGQDDTCFGTVIFHVQGCADRRMHDYPSSYNDR